MALLAYLFCGFWIYWGAQTLIKRNYGAKGHVGFVIGISLSTIMNMFYIILVQK